MTSRVTVLTTVVSEAIAAHRKREGLSRAEFAATCWAVGAPESFTGTVVGHLEAGRRSPGGRLREITLDELVLLAAAMRTTPLALLGEHAGAFGADQPIECQRCAGRGPGLLEARVRADLEDWGELDSLSMEPSLAETACTLAAQIDLGGEGGKQLPQLAKELRCTLDVLAAGRRNAESDDGAVDDELGDLDEPD